MLKALNTPLRPLPALAAAFAVIAAIAIYCLSYTAFAGRAESPLDAIGWAVVNVLPWLAAFEIAKRVSRPAGKAAVVAAALFVSLALQWLLLDGSGSPGFELVRRLPGLIATSALVAVGGLARSERRAAGDAGELPLAPAQLDWIAAAGNYVELHGCGRILLFRASLGAVEERLRGHGFVRIHRSTIVRRERIARVRPADVLLRDGTSLRTGKRFRASLAAE
jgi:DNA-binding LytR/AlgR family response regulator